MLTILLYVVVIAVVAVVLFVLASVVFGRGEELEPLPEGTTATALPARGIVGRDIRALRFSVRLRGYDAKEVDWALDRLAVEIDGLRLRLHEGGRQEPGRHESETTAPETGAPETAVPETAVPETAVADGPDESVR